VTTTEIIRKVISGGQNGVDLAALRAAKTLGFSTGGRMPRHWITLDGPRPEYAGEFGMSECCFGGYAARTSANVRDSDFTLRIAKNVISPGERCTLSAIVGHKKPYADILIRSEWSYDSQQVDAAVGAIFVCRGRMGRAIVLNIAGNSEKTCPGMGDFAFDLVCKILEVLR
jgi:Circularly permutated YpsA SLOG family